MTDEEIQEVIEEAFGNTGNVVGLNNHMGSAIMEDERCLQMVVEELKNRDLFFLDSVTTPNSKGEALCEKYGVYFMKRDVFLDGTDDVSVVKDNLIKAANKALDNGSAIAIGHVGPEGGTVTVNAIKEMSKELEGMGIEFVTLSELKEIKYGNIELSN